MANDKVHAEKATTTSVMPTVFTDRFLITLYVYWFDKDGCVLTPHTPVIFLTRDWAGFSTDAVWTLVLSDYPYTCFPFANCCVSTTPASCMG